MNVGMCVLCIRYTLKRNQSFILLDAMQHLSGAPFHTYSYRSTTATTYKLMCG